MIPPLIIHNYTTEVKMSSLIVGAVSGRDLICLVVRCALNS